MYRLFFFSLITLLSFIAIGDELQAQTGAYIYGKITDIHGQPIPSANIYSEATGHGTTSDFDGNYKLYLPHSKMLYIKFSFTGSKTQAEQIYLRDENDLREINIMLQGESQMLEITTVRGRSSFRTPGITPIPSKVIEQLPTAGRGVEALIPMVALGVSSKSELSSQYSVRGGNFDENLVYVNDFEIYRPFLIRSGQQEGLSFINPDMVSEISFSSGGFESKYGDKMSSVLDVKYRKPKEFGGTVGLSLLGGNVHLEGTAQSRRFTYNLGVRHKSNRYLLNALPTSGQYQPSFTDVQAFLTYQLRENWELQFIGNFAGNLYRFTPVEQETSFGTFNESFKLRVYFDGQERDSYKTLMGGLGVVHTPSDRLTLKFLSSAYRSEETESFDIIGQYWIGETENDLGDEDFGEFARILGVGTYHDWARNKLYSYVINGAHKGYLNSKNERHFISWGAKYQHEIIEDKLNEWYRLDSAGYSLPLSGSEVLFADVLKTKIDLNSNRLTGFVQNDWTIGKDERFKIIGGVRFNYWDLNKEFLVIPRAQIAFRPKLKGEEEADSSASVAPATSLPDLEKTEPELEGKSKKKKKNKKRKPERGENMVERDLVFRLAGGAYHQPAFYRELRNFDGEINTNLKAQKSWHVLLGADYTFNMWERPFKFTAEAYYKHLNDLVPYDLDNLLIRYFGRNNAKGHAYGLDLRLNGEFVPGTESWLTLGYLKTQENLYDDYIYYDSEGSEIVPGITASAVADSTELGYVPRPTDQRISFGLFFQDYWPTNENFKMHLMLLFGTGLPFSPANGINPKFRNAFRTPTYRRVDIGFSAQLFDREKRELAEKSVFRHFRSIWASIEIFNLLGVKNTVSYTWIQAQNRVYGIPNHLTSRLINGRLIVKF